MAAGTMGGSERRGRRRRRYQPMAEINVTPFVDVMLVLLIVFMVSAPLLTVGVPIDLPESKASDLGTPQEPVTISIDADGHIFLDDDEITLNTLIDRLSAVAEPTDRVYVRGDRSISYGLMMRIMGELNGAGYSRIGLVSLGERES